MVARIRPSPPPVHPRSLHLPSSRAAVGRPPQIVELHARSPLSVVDGVRAPSLMLLGAGDLRVPPSQGRQWVAAVQQCARAPAPMALSFPGEGHAIASLEANAHAQQTAVAWLLEHLGPEPPTSKD